MARKLPTRLRVHGPLAREIGLAIVSGRFLPGHVMDGEIEASARRRVSRTAYREAMRSLSAKGLLQSRPRTGTRVSDISQWHLLDPDVLEWLFSGTPRQEVIHGLFELRSLVEPAAAALAASRRKREHLAEMRRALDDMARHTLHEPEGREADKAFPSPTA
jgi:DNA-binding FadR family transcriptional regulator